MRPLGASLLARATQRNAQADSDGRVEFPHVGRHGRCGSTSGLTQDVDSSELLNRGQHCNWAEYDRTSGYRRTNPKSSRGIRRVIASGNRCHHSEALFLRDKLPANERIH